MTSTDNSRRRSSFYEEEEEEDFSPVTPRTRLWKQKRRSAQIIVDVMTCLDAPKVASIQREFVKHPDNAVDVKEFVRIMEDHLENFGQLREQMYQGVTRSSKTFQQKFVVSKLNFGVPFKLTTINKATTTNRPPRRPKRPYSSSSHQRRRTWQQRKLMNNDQQQSKSSIQPTCDSSNITASNNSATARGTATMLLLTSLGNVIARPKSLTARI